MHLVETPLIDIHLVQKREKNEPEYFYSRLFEAHPTMYFTFKFSPRTKSLATPATECFTDLNKLKLIMMIWFKA